MLDLICELYPEPAGCRVLDVSCKAGELLRELKRRGFEVRGTRLEQGLAPIEGVPVDSGVDLLRGLPYPEGSFDVVVLADLLEHLENHAPIIAELARVVRPGGRLIVSTVNVMRLDSRLAFLLSGLHKTKRRLMPLDTPLGDAWTYHNHPIPFPYLYYLLLGNGLEVDRLGRSRVKAIAYVLYVLFYPLVAANSGFRLLVRERRYLRRRGPRPSLELNRRLMRWMVSRRVLMDDHLIVSAVKWPVAP